jgi:hypothetical protein
MGQQLISAMQTPQPANASVPPPPPIQPQWYLSCDGQNLGPFSINQLLQNGLTPQAFVWRTGMTDWQPANTVAELAALLPPSLPPRSNA